MGVINLDAFITQYGVSVSNTYISIANNTMNIQKQDNKPTVLTATFSLYHSKDLRTQNLKCYEKIMICRDLTASEMAANTNLFALLYDQLKLQFTNTTDDL